MASSWRSAADWKACNLPFTTTSDRACKLYDAALTQYITWSDIPTMGGLEKTLKDCVTEDPNFVMGRVIAVGLDLISTGHSSKLDPAFQQELDELYKLASTQPINDREKLHVKALKHFSDGYLDKAACAWEDILTDHPTDMLALKLAHDTYFYMGQSNNIRDSIASVFPQWKSSVPLYSYLYGMHAFGLEETNLYPQAEAAAKKALELNRTDAWATHALAHVYEMQGRTGEGIAFMSTTLGDWKSSNYLAKHNYWHWGLYHIEQGESDAAVELFQNCINNNIRNGSTLDIVDCTSMLWRLKMEGVNVKELWTEVMDTCRSHLDDHLLLFNDTHYLMACLGSGDKQATEKLTQSLENFIRDGSGNNWTTSKEFGKELFMGMTAIAEERYSDAIKYLLPIKDKLQTMGGSHAQRDLFNIALILSAVKSSDPKDQALARKLLLSRQMFKGKCSLAQRFNCQLQPFLEV